MKPQIKGLDPKKIELQIKWENAGTVSMSSQSEPDELVIGFAPDFELTDVNGYALILGGGEPTDDGGTNFFIPA